MLIVAGSLNDLFGGLALGADDYLSKPFSYAEPPPSSPGKDATTTS